VKIRILRPAVESSNSNAKDFRKMNWLKIRARSAGLWSIRDPKWPRTLCLEKT